VRQSSLIRTIALGFGLIVLCAADAPPPSPATTPEALNDAAEAVLRANRVLQLQLEMARRREQPTPVVNVTAPPAVVNVAPTPVVAESDSAVVIKQIRDAALPVLVAGILAFLGVVAAKIPAATTALSQWIDLRLNVYQQDRVYAAANTAAGQIETKLDRHALTVGEVTEDSPKIRAIVADALRPVKESAAAQGANVDTVTPIVIARVDTGSRKT
jgi:hypothetical protein